MPPLKRPARSKQDGRRPTNEYLVRMEPDTYTALAALAEANAPESMNSIINKAIRYYCARELGAKEGTA